MRVANYFLVFFIVCVMGCSGEEKGEPDDVAINLPANGDVLNASILLEDPINPRRDDGVSSWELTLDESSELLEFFRHAKRALAPNETLKWEGSGNLTLISVDKEVWRVGLFLVGERLIFKVVYPAGNQKYFEANESAESFNEKLKRLFS